MIIPSTFTCKLKYNVKSDLLPGWGSLLMCGRQEKDAFLHKECNLMFSVSLNTFNPIRISYLSWLKAIADFDCFSSYFGFGLWRKWNRTIGLLCIFLGYHTVQLSIVGIIHTWIARMFFGIPQGVNRKIVYKVKKNFLPRFYVRLHLKNNKRINLWITQH